jgi:hypothetical protein
MSITIQQQRVSLRCADNFVTFDWPLGADEVTISGTYHPAIPTIYSVEEAAEVFDLLLRHGAY